MRVLVVASAVGTSPNEIAYSFVFDEVVRLASKGLEVHVARGRVDRYRFSHGVHFHGLERWVDPVAVAKLPSYITKYPLAGLLRHPGALYFESLYASNVQRIVAQINADIIHAHFAYQEGWIGYLTSLSTKKPLVVTTHGFDIQVVPEIRYGARLDRRLDILIKKVLNNADAIIVPSTVMYKIVQSIVNNKNKVYLIPNGVDLNIFTPNINKYNARKLINVDENQFYIFTARHHRPVYGIEFLIKAIPFIVRKVENVKFIVSGDGPLRTYHENLARKLNVRSHLIFTGYVPRSLMPFYIAASDIIVIPSLMEGLPIFALEALATGRPIVGSHVGGLVDCIINGYNGFLVPPKNPQALAEKIVYLLENPHELERMGFNGRKLAEEKFNIEKRIDKIIEVYKQVLTER